MVSTISIPEAMPKQQHLAMVGTISIPEAISKYDQAMSKSK